MKHFSLFLNPLFDAENVTVPLCQIIRNFQFEVANISSNENVQTSVISAVLNNCDDSFERCGIEYDGVLFIASINKFETLQIVKTTYNRRQSVCI